MAMRTMRTKAYPVLGVLAQVDRRDHPEGHDQNDAHDERHHDGAEDGGEDAALGVRLARFFHDVRPGGRDEMPALFGEAHAIGVPIVDELGVGDLGFFAGAEFKGEVRFPLFGAKLAGAGGKALVFRLEFRRFFLSNCFLDVVTTGSYSHICQILVSIKS
jgi:hypothetical protein